MGVSRFEDLTVWNAARALCREIVPIMRRPAFFTDSPLRQHLNSAAISTVATIAEGFLRGSRKELAQYLRIAAGSNGEVRAILYIAKDRFNPLPAVQQLRARVLLHRGHGWLR